ncbi:MAG: tetratricopeptide repeat protein [Isosphaeraceae bacterium]
MDHQPTHKPPSRNRTGRRLLALGLPLMALVALTGWNVTSSDALDQAQQAYVRGDLVGSLRRALDHLHRRPWSRQAALLAARCFSRLDYPELAEPYYRRSGPLSLDDLQVRAFGLVRGNHRRDAITAYEEILGRWPDNVTALRRLAAVQLSENNIPQLNGLAERLVKTPGGAAIGHTLRGVVAHNQHDHEGAVMAFEQVLALDPELRSMPLPRSLFWSHLAEGLIKLGRFDDAIRYLTAFLGGTSDAPLMITLGRAHLLAGSFPEAERCFKQAADWGPGNYVPWLQLGRLELQRQRLAEAERHLETARKLAPRQAEVLNALASAYRLLNRPADVARVRQLLKDLPPRSSGDASRGDRWPSYAL